MEILCPSCEKKLLLKLHPELHCSIWCGTCQQEIPPETLTEGGAPSELIARIDAWGPKARDLLEVEDEGVVGGDRSDEEYVRNWNRLRDETVELLRALREFLPAGTNVFGAPKPPDWKDEEIVHWRRQREREGLLYSFGFQLGARNVEEEGGLPLDDADSLPIPYPTACVTPSERKRFHAGFAAGSRTGPFDSDLFAEIQAKLRGRK